VTSTPVTGPRCSLQHHLRQLLEAAVRPPQLITAGAGLTHQLGHRGGLLLFQSGPARPPFGRSTPRPRPLLYRIIRGARARTTSGHVMKFHAPTLQLPPTPGLSGDGVSWRDRNTETATVPARPSPGFLLTTVASPPLITGGASPGAPRCMSVRPPRRPACYLSSSSETPEAPRKDLVAANSRATDLRGIFGSTLGM